MKKMGHPRPDNKHLSRKCPDFIAADRMNGSAGMDDDDFIEFMVMFGKGGIPFLRLDEAFSAVSVYKNRRVPD
jgi:hypothetical protein